jgi:hypothetical protein
MKNVIISLSLLFASLFLSCKKELPLIVENTGIPLLSKVIIDNQPSCEYLFNGANLISEVKSKIDFTRHEYNDKNQLVSTEYFVNFDLISRDALISETATRSKEWVSTDISNKCYAILYEYNSNELLIKATYSRPLAGSSEYSEFSYDVNNRISRQAIYWDNSETGYIDYSYDGKGNLVKGILYYLSSAGVAELSTTTQYEFDNEQNPFKSFSRLIVPGINTNLNNIVKETHTIHIKGVQGTEKVVVTQNSYEYNTEGYPITRNGNVRYEYK